MVPRSNCSHIVSICRGGGATNRTYVDTAGQRIRRKAHLEPELVDALLETTLSAEDNLIFEQRSQAIAQIFRTSTTAPWPERSHIRARLASRHRIPVYLDHPMQTNNQMCDADGSYNGQNNGTFDRIAGEVGTPRIVGFDVDIANAAIAVTQLRAKAG